MGALHHHHFVGALMMVVVLGRSAAQVSFSEAAPHQGLLSNSTPSLQRQTKWVPDGLQEVAVACPAGEYHLTASICCPSEEFLVSEETHPECEAENGGAIKVSCGLQFSFRERHLTVHDFMIYSTSDLRLVIIYVGV